MTLSTIERVFLLQGAALFRQVPIQELVGIAQLCQEVTFRSGERFIEAGEPGECLYILATGQASVEMEGVGQIALSKQGDVIGEMAIISNNPRSASCVALSDITALQITHADFWTLMEENPAVTSSVLKVIVKRLEDTLLQLRQATGKALQPGA